MRVRSPALRDAQGSPIKFRICPITYVDENELISNNQSNLLRHKKVIRHHNFQSS